MTQFTLGHIIYIPATILIGMLVGWILGGRAARAELLQKERQDDAKAARQAERAMRMAQRQGRSQAQGE
jgi:hypothetical protein